MENVIDAKRKRGRPRKQVEEIESVKIDSDYYTPAEFCAKAQISISTFRRMIRNKEIPHSLIGGQIRIEKLEYERYKKKQRIVTAS